MKLIKKLLPVATLGSVAAVVVPLATSCTNGGSSFDFSQMPVTSGWKLSETEECDETQAADEYADAVAQDQNVFINDEKYGTYWGMSLARQQILTKMISGTGVKDIELDVSKSNASISNISISENSGYPSISFASTIEMSCLYKYTAQTKSTSMDDYSNAFNFKISTTVDNMPISIHYYSGMGQNASNPLAWYLPIPFQATSYIDWLEDLTDKWSFKIEIAYDLDYHLSRTMSKGRIIKESANYCASTVNILNNNYINEIYVNDLIPDYESGTFLLENPIEPMVMFAYVLAPIQRMSYYYLDTEVTFH